MDDIESRSRAKRFSDYVRLHAAGEKVISLPTEIRLLRAGVNDFGLDLDDAMGSLMAIANHKNIVLESQSERPTRVMIQHITKGKRISKQKFKEAVQFYRSLNNDAISEQDANKRVKKIVEDDGLRVKRNLIGLRRWYNRIAKPDPVA
ncbi:MAG: hypothetical protein K2X44_12600 [Magnetospirillum sp.]|nr:hypothetical protein [Magnetospirillum sp.]